MYWFIDLLIIINYHFKSFKSLCISFINKKNNSKCLPMIGHLLSTHSSLFWYLLMHWFIDYYQLPLLIIDQLIFQKLQKFVHFLHNLNAFPRAYLWLCIFCLYILLIYQLLAFIDGLIYWLLIINRGDATYWYLASMLICLHFYTDTASVWLIELRCTDK